MTLSSLSYNQTAGDAYYQGVVVDPEEYFHLPIRYHELRSRLREFGLPSGVLRKVWWPVLVRVASKQSLETFPDIATYAKKKYTWGLCLGASITKDPIGPIFLSWDEAPAESVAYNTIRLLVQCYDMEDPGLIQPLVMCLARTITNSAICFTICCDLIDRRDWFINPSSISHRLKLCAFKEILKRRIPQTYSTLTALGALAEQYLNLIYVDLFTTLIPTQYADRIVRFFFQHT